MPTSELAGRSATSSDSKDRSQLASLRETGDDWGLVADAGDAFYIYIHLMDVINKLLTDRPPYPIYHYTDAAASISILERKQLWATKIRHLNDGTEYVHARDWLVEELRRRDTPSLSKGLKAVQEATGLSLSGGDLGRTVVHGPETDAPVYVVSFSGRKDLLSQWRGYCPSGNGYAFGFDVGAFPSQPLSRIQLVKCAYGPTERERLCKALIESWGECDPHSQADVARLYRNTVTVMAAIKDKGFEEEDEWRIVSIHPEVVRFRPGRHGIVPYTPIDIAPDGFLKLNEIWLGPNSDADTASSALTLLLKTSGFENVTLEKSETPIR